MKIHRFNLIRRHPVCILLSSAILAFLAVGLSLWLLTPPQVARAATGIVTSTDDSGPGTLRQAIADASPGDTIIFNNSLSGQMITLSSPLVITQDLTIDGSTLPVSVTVSGNIAVRVFQVYTGTNATFDSLIIAYGKTTDPEFYGYYSIGGGLKIEPGAAVTLTHSAVISNTTATYLPDWEMYVGYGGGIFNQGTLAVINSSFSRNTASNGINYGDGSGGAIFSMGTLQVTDSIFYNNRAPQGAGIASGWEGTMSVQNSHFTGNAAPCGGSGIANDNGEATVSDSTVADNTAPGTWCEGGAAGISNRYGTMTVTQSIISGNSNESHSGGGLSNYEGKLTVQDCTIYSNTSGSHGGGIYNWYNVALTVTNSIIYGNTASYYGGGILNGPDGGASLYLVNGAVFGNTAQRGGGIFNGSPFNDSGAVLTITNSTLVGNTATLFGGGLYNKEATPTLANTILWSNTAPTGTQIYNTSTKPFIGSSDIQDSGGSGAGWDTAIGDDDGGNLDNDPLFVDAVNHDLRLSSASPAIDASDNTLCPTTDQRGDLRSDLGCDMGAYETQLSDSATISRTIATGQSFTFGPTLARVNVTNAGTCTGLAITRANTDHPQAGSNTNLSTGVHWTITPDPSDCSGLSVTLRLPALFDGFDTGAQNKLCRWDDTTGWDCGQASDNSNVTEMLLGSASQNYVERQSVSEFSDWTVGDSVSPTNLTLGRLSAQSQRLLPLVMLAGVLGLLAVGTTFFYFSGLRKGVEERN